MPDDAPNSWEARADAHTFYGFTDLPSVSKRGALVLERGQGAHVYDVHGKRFLDANSGLWNMVAGFDHPALAAAAKAQYDRFPGYHVFFGRMADTAVELSERLIEVSPFPRGKIFYSNSGSEANDTLVKMLWFLAGQEDQPKRRKILTRWNGYHGVTVVAASMTGKPYNRQFGLPLDGFIHLTSPHFRKEGKPGETEADFTARLATELDDVIAQEGADTIAGFVAEPVIGAGGVIPPPDGYFQAIQPVLRRHGIPLIADEVICGFGRTGNIWGSQTYDFVPDAIIASKAITAGYFPMGAVILGPELTDRLQAASEKVGEFPHGFTASGHPVGCAIALKAIDIIVDGDEDTPPLIDNVRRLTPRFTAGLAEIASRANIGEVRQSGLMGALEAVADKATDTPFDPSLSVSERIANTCADHGLICRPLGPSIVLCPPFIMTDADMNELFEKLGAALDQTFAEIT
ncbi:MAG: aminotransferase [Pseudomonadota bacterium]